jgi:hypothetical protein
LFHLIGWSFNDNTPGVLVTFCFHRTVSGLGQGQGLVIVAGHRRGTEMDIVVVLGAVLLVETGGIVDVD